MDEWVIGAGIIMSVIVLPMICLFIMSIGFNETDTLSSQRIIISILLSIFIYMGGLSYLSHLSYEFKHSHDDEIKNTQMHNGTITQIDTNDEYYKINLKNKGITYRFDEERSKITREDLHDVIKKQNQAKVKYKIYKDDMIIIFKIQNRDN